MNVIRWHEVGFQATSDTSLVTTWTLAWTLFTRQEIVIQINYLWYDMNVATGQLINMCIQQVFKGAIFWICFPMQNDSFHPIYSYIIITSAQISTAKGLKRKVGVILTFRKSVSWWVWWDCWAHDVQALGRNHMHCISSASPPHPLKASYQSTSRWNMVISESSGKDKTEGGWRGGKAGSRQVDFSGHPTALQK